MVNSLFTTLVAGAVLPAVDGLSTVSLQSIKALYDLSSKTNGTLKGNFVTINEICQDVFGLKCKPDTDLTQNKFCKDKDITGIDKTGDYENVVKFLKDFKGEGFPDSMWIKSTMAPYLWMCVKGNAFNIKDGTANTIQACSDQCNKDTWTDQGACQKCGVTKADWDNLRKNDNPGLDQLAFGYDAIPYAVEKMGYFGIETIIGGKFADAAPKIVKIGQQRTALIKQLYTAFKYMPGCGCVATNSTPVVVKEDALGVKPDVVEQCTSFRQQVSGLTTTRTILIITTAVLGAAAIALGLMAFGVIQNPFPTS